MSDAVNDRHRRSIRRLRVLTSAIVIVDMALFAALVPLLPRFTNEFDLSSTGAGLLVAAFAAGALVGAIPGGLAAARYGAKLAVIAGLVTLSLASVGFALADSAVVLGLARFVQGFGSVFAWAGILSWLVAMTPRDRRGEMLGTAMGAAVFGALLGPVLGVIASWIGVEVAFSSVAAIALLLVFGAVRTQDAPPKSEPFRGILRAVQNRAFAGLIWLVVLPALVFGAIAVLIPLRLDAFGWGTAAIGAVFLVGAAGEMILAPIAGRFSDRRGRQLPIQLGLAGFAGLCMGLAWADFAFIVAALTVAVAVSYAAILTPSVALLMDAADRFGLASGIAFGLMNAAWAAGTIIGPVSAGALADLSGDALPFVIAALLSATTLAVLSTSWSPERAPSSAGDSDSVAR